MIVVVTAEADLKQIAAYVAEQNPWSALTLIREFQAGGLSKQPILFELSY